MTTTTVVVGLILIFVLFTRTGRALCALGVVILGLWLGPTIWRNFNAEPEKHAVSSMDRDFYRTFCGPNGSFSPKQCADERAKTCGLAGDGAFANFDPDGKKAACVNELDALLRRPPM
jgi:hypothetical protein